jgi:sec-independent protein translocase protein TatA
MFGSLGMWEVLVILFIVLLLFGARRLPEIGGSLGKGIREFKGSLREVEGELKDSLKEVEGELKEIGGSDATASGTEQTEEEKEKQPQA